jgi:amino acid adenylation domain-containing protein
MTSYPQEVTTSSTAPSEGFHSAYVPQAVAAKAAKWPESVALTAGSQVMTYGELEVRANRLARHLRFLGVGPNVLVGLCLSRSLDMVVAVLAILKAGGAYVPMDPAYPPDRLAFMMDDAQAPVLIANHRLARQMSSKQRIVINMNAPEIARQPDQPLRDEALPGDLAYVIYTSGSTGTPKGVEILRSSLANLVSWHQRAFSVTSGDRASHLAGLGFDAAAWELWPYLAAGASVHLVDAVTRNSAELLRDWLLTRKITISFVPTPLAERLLALEWPSQAPLRILLTGGDALHHYPPANLPFELINNYGPTECTVVATSGPVFPGSHLDLLPAIGRPIDNTHIYLLDDHLKPVQPGRSGEIHIGGAGVARGYHNRPDLTEEKFIPNPFSSPPGRMYKTGDVGRLLPDGQIEFLGRVDDQIKIRGYRIEPNEIVSTLNRHPDVRESLVVSRDDGHGDTRLVAYLVLEPDSAPSHTALCGFVRDHLPEYMLPAAFIRLEEFPLTPHGKIDRAALPAPNPANTLQDAISAHPGTQTELRIAEILSRLLGRENVGRDDNFFLLGGHSLLGAQLMTRLRAEFNVEISLRNLFDAPTVASLSAKVECLKANGKTPGEADTAHSCRYQPDCVDARA